MRTEGHKFHIPVMGTGFTIDTPLRVAKFGINSVISLVDDELIEEMRKFHSQKNNEPYEQIHRRDEDSRARRIREYLNLLDRLIKKQLEEMKSLEFGEDNDLTKYFEMLPDNLYTKQLYLVMKHASGEKERKRIQLLLKDLIKPGTIDVNIMTKLDRKLDLAGKDLGENNSDALSALRGYATSNLESSLVFSAGLNPKLYSYAAEFEDFAPLEGAPKKKIILKVSDYRSAKIQGKFLAKRGLWVSEFRIESGINCGGHAFVGNGLLLGPVLEEFKVKKQELVEELDEVYKKTLKAKARGELTVPLETKITVQGGIGTNDENDFLIEHFNLDSAGWGTPFLLVPEATSVDDAHLEKLKAAKKENVSLSGSSPLGVPLWSLVDSASEKRRHERIESGKPGSPCVKGFVAMNTEFGDKPICIASISYQKQKLNELENSDLPQLEFEELKKGVLAKACICHDLAGGATLKEGIDSSAKPFICCGPNIESFSETYSLKEMVDHIYGRASVLNDSNRPHMFIKELMLYVDHLKNNSVKSFDEFTNNLLEGISFYKDLAADLSQKEQAKFRESLSLLTRDLDRLGLEHEAKLA